jgi:tetratricopeptide (TPR) repeat protein
MGAGDYPAAREALQLVETLLLLRGVEELSREHLLVLGRCLSDLSVCHCHASEFNVALTAATRAVTYLGSTGELTEKAHALQQVGRVYCQAGNFRAALKQWGRVRALYEELGLKEDLVRLRKDGAALLRRRGDPQQAFLRQAIPALERGEERPPEPPAFAPPELRAVRNPGRDAGAAPRTGGSTPSESDPPLPGA